MMRATLRGVPLSAALVLLAASTVSAQTVAQIVDQVYEAYERHARGVDNYTMVQTAMGFETTTYFVKEMVDGRPVFKMQGTYAGGMSFGLGDDDVGYGDVFLLGPDLVEHGRYAGREDVGGVDTHVIAIDDVSALDIMTPSGPDDMDFVPQRARLYIDADMMAPRRMEFEGEMITDDGPRPITMQMTMDDYRETDGLLLPWSMVMEIQGMEAMMDPETAAQLAEMEKQLESMPQAQRAMMERMMGEQMERMKEMMSGEGMTMEITVTEVRVNSGPPSG